MRAPLALALAVWLSAGCQEGAPDAPPEVSRNEAEALEDAAEMIGTRPPASATGATATATPTAQP